MSADGHHFRSKLNRKATHEAEIGLDLRWFSVGWDPVHLIEQIENRDVQSGEQRVSQFPPQTALAL